ncbi:hypothetical protein D0O09_22320 [Pseudomonas putida]|nr:hypothetical protein D0O09_22320 [Pseudomonas putida]
MVPPGGVCDHVAVGELLGEFRARLVAGIITGRFAPQSPASRLPQVQCKPSGWRSPCGSRLAGD